MNHSMEARTAPDLSVVVPCFNEEGNAQALFDRLLASLNDAGISFEAVFVDDGSTDDTWARITVLGESHGSLIRAVKHERNRGIAAAWQSGLDAATASIVCFIDADLQNPPEAIPQMWRTLWTSHADLVQAVRSTLEWDRDRRYYLSRSLNRLLNTVFRDGAKDSKSGFVLAPKTVLQDVLSSALNYRYFQTMIRVSARSLGYSVVEVETIFFPRQAGVSFIDGQKTVSIALGTILDVGRAVREFGSGRQHPMARSDLFKRSASRSFAKDLSARRRARFELYFATMPLHTWLLSRRTRTALVNLESMQWRSREELRALQDERLVRLIQHAYTRVPYYRRVFQECGLTPSSVQSRDDLSRIPLLNKSDVRRHAYFELFSDDYQKRGVHRISTSGSTGEPFVTYADKHQLEVRFATTLRALRWTGWEFGDPQLRLWHQKLGMSRSQAFRERLDAMLLRRHFIPAFEINQEGLETMVREIEKVRPVLMDGYAESLNFLATYLKQGGRLRVAPKALMSSAQVLPQQTRALIESSLDAKVFDKYGAREFSGIAYQCSESSNLHVMDESYILEIVVDGRPAQPGEVGEVVITDLNNFSFPLIRYRIGDLATAVDNTTACPCGRGLSQIGPVQGRTQAIVHCANGRWLPGTFFAHFFKDYDDQVRQFQVVQSSPGEFDLKIVKGPHWSESSFTDLIDALREFVGETTIRVDYVSEVPLLATGKRSPVVSTVPMDFQLMGSPITGSAAP